MTDKRRGPAAPVQLIDASITVKELSLQRYFMVQVGEIRFGMPAIVGDDLVAGAVITDLAAERDMKIQGQRRRD